MGIGTCRVQGGCPPELHEYHKCVIAILVISLPHACEQYLTNEYVILSSIWVTQLLVALPWQ